MNQDQEHLRLLSVFHYVMAGLACLLPLVSLLYIGLGVAMLNGKMPSSSPAAAHGDLIGAGFFVAVGCMFFFVGVVGAVLNILAGRALARRERRNLCLVVASLNCLHMPLGTLLGVFTLIVLARPSVQALFNATAQGSLQGAWPPVGQAPVHPPQTSTPGTSPFSNQNP